MKLNHKGKNTIKINSSISVVVELEAYKKMKCYIDLCNKEVGWLGTAYKYGNEIRITDVFLFDQEVHATTCELTPAGIADFVTNLYMSMESDEAMEISNNLTCWGHSHVNMGVSPSGQDDIQLRSFASSGHEWFLRVIGNKRGEFEYTYIDYNNGIEIRDVDWRIDIPGLDFNELKSSIKEEINTKVREKKMQIPAWDKGRYATYNRGTAYVSTSRGVEPLYPTQHNQVYNESLFDEDYFDNYISQQNNLHSTLFTASNQDIMDEEDILASLGVSANHDVIMDIVGNNSDLISDEEYQILDEALCQLTLDELACIGSYEMNELAITYITGLTSDYFSLTEMEELYTVCVKNRAKLNELVAGRIK